MCLMAINAVFFGWKFMEGSAPQATSREKAMPQVGARIQLLSEAKLPPAAAPAPAVAEEAPAAEPVATAGEAPARQCFNVGPFGTEGEARSFASSMRGKHFIARIDKRKVDVKDYWVFIPAFTNREKADEKLRDLRSRGIQGFVVKDGMFVNAISLNHFSRKELAQSYLEKMHSSGVQVEFREMASVGAEPWTYLSPGSSKDDLRGAIDGFLNGHPGLKREITACED
ncbi:MAG TPA: SPOR domain-containing protein [Moraxellaceae bacterium]|nr:SPOR domain-containing protein [Moraxellaceae bacterium]